MKRRATGARGTQGETRAPSMHFMGRGMALEDVRAQCSAMPSSALLPRVPPRPRGMTWHLPSTVRLSPRRAPPYTCAPIAHPGRCGGTGRRAGLKIRFWQQSVGSIPSTGTKRPFGRGRARPPTRLLLDATDARAIENQSAAELGPPSRWVHADFGGWTAGPSGPSSAGAVGTRPHRVLLARRAPRAACLMCESGARRSHWPGTAVALRSADSARTRPERGNQHRHQGISEADRSDS